MNNARKWLLGAALFLAAFALAVDNGIIDRDKLPDWVPDTEPRPDDTEPRPDDLLPGELTVAPIALPGFKVLYVYESETETPQEANVRDSSKWRLLAMEYGGQDCVRALDPQAEHIDGAPVTKPWADAMKLATDLPWIVISKENKGGYSGPAPKSVDEVVKLVEKWGKP